jgi:hypothetical protein
MVHRHVSRLASSRSALLVLFWLLVLCCGCKKDPDKAAPIASASADLATRGPRASCNLLDQQGTCTELAKEQPVEKTLCEGLRGRWSAAPCPAEGRVGTCEKEGGETKRYYKTFVELRSFTPEEAKADCESELIRGKFTGTASAVPAAPKPSGGARSPK